MYRLIVKIFIVLLPYIICIIAIIAIDPHNIFEVSPLFSEASKKRVMHRSVNTIMYDNAIYDFNKFKKHSSPNVILGDSRPFLFDLNYINTRSQDKYMNLSIPGGDLKSICDSLEFALKVTKIHNVVIGISFHNSTAKSRSDLVPVTEKVLNDKISYFIDRRTLGACIALLNYNKIDYNLKQRKIRNADGRMTRWKKVLDDLPLDNYEYPHNELNRLMKLIDGLKHDKVNVTFIFFPNHTDVENRIVVHDLLKYEEQFKKSIERSNVVYDFNYPNIFTTNYDNYRDPLHPKDWAFNLIANSVFTFTHADREKGTEIPYKLFNNGVQMH